MGDDRARAAERLSQPDSIMAADVAATIATYLKASGSPPELIHMLCSNYQGFAQMSNLIESWLVRSGASEDEIRAVAQEHVRAAILGAYDDAKATEAFFAADNAEAARWVGELIQHEEWRRLVYELSDRHPESLLLSYVIKQVAVAGHQREIAEISSVSNHLDVFAAVLSDWIAEAVRADEDHLQDVLPKIVAMATTSQQAYVYCQTLLHAMFDGPLEPAARRLSEEVHLHCEHKDVAVHVEFQLSEDGHTAGDGGGEGGGPAAEIEHAVAAVLETCRTGHQLFALHRMYASEGRPPARCLRFPGFLDVLIGEVFVPDFDPARGPEIELYVYLLAHAATATDDRGGGGGGGHDDAPELEPTAQAIRDSLAVLHTGILTASGVDTLLEGIAATPVVARGVICWLERVVGQPDFFVTNDAPTLPPHFALLDEVTARHPLLRDAALDLLLGFVRQPYNVDTLAAVRLKRRLLDRVVYVFATGHATRALRRVMEESLDVPLAVHFLNEVLRTIAPPCSPRVFALLCEFLGRPEVFAVFSGKVVERAAVITFLEAGVANPRGGEIDAAVADGANALKRRYLKAA